MILLYMTIKILSLLGSKKQTNKQKQQQKQQTPHKTHGIFAIHTDFQTPDSENYEDEPFGQTLGTRDL